MLRSVLNILVRNASPRGPMCFRCPIFSLSGPCELLFLLFCYSFLDLRSSECDVSLYVLCCSVSGSACFVWLEVHGWIDHVWSSKEYVCQ